MDVSSTPAPPRRPYKRVSAREWEQHKDRIRELFIDQGNTHEDVVDILRENHDFDIGLRQLKRKCDQWGFARNIPKRDMFRMVRKRKERQEELGKPTNFIRRHGVSALQDVPQERLDRFEKRFGTGPASPMFALDGTPSHIMYHTPSHDHGTPISKPPSATRASREATIEFNGSVGDTFRDSASDGLSPRATSTSASIRSASTPRELITLMYASARNNAFDGDYTAAARKLQYLYNQIVKVQDRNHFAVIGLEFSIALLKVAEFPGCPQSITARITQELSRFLTRQRQRYIQAAHQATSPTDLRKLIKTLKSSATWYTMLLVQQRALQIWEPLLGSGHVKIQQMHDNLATMRMSPLLKDRPTAQPEQEEAEVEEDLNDNLDLENLVTLRSIKDLLHLEADSPEQLLQKFQALGRSDMAGCKLRQDLIFLRYGRCRSVLAGYYSFLERYDVAERAFQDSARYMKYEVCTEVKLHRMLWYAEHKTRTGDWPGMESILEEAQDIFTRTESPSEFIKAHFPSRFQALRVASWVRVPIDQFANEAPNTSEVEQRHNPMIPLNQQAFLQGPSPPSDPVAFPFAQRGFSLSPNGLGPSFSIEAWRQFIEFSPTAG